MLKLRPKQRLEILRSLGPERAKALLYDWRFWGRPAQHDPGVTPIWFPMSGRGAGKTRTGAEFVRARVDQAPAWALIGPTTALVRDLMVEGPSGLLAVFPPWHRPDYNPSLRRVTFHTGARADLYSAEEPDHIRGANFGAFWYDEIAAWKNAKEVYEVASFGWRDPRRPKRGAAGIITSTPRPIPLIEELAARKNVTVTRESTFANAANLDPDRLAELLDTYAGTSLGRQELYGEILDEVDGALWTRLLIDRGRIAEADRPPLEDFDRIVVAVDPSGSSDGDEVGIIVAGRVGRRIYVLADYSGHHSPERWASLAVLAFEEWEANAVIGEVNFGGDMVERTLRTVEGGAGVPFRKLHASRGKDIRAEPVIARYEQTRVHHVGAFATLERQMCTWTSEVKDWSPDRMDALVWACRELVDRQPYRWGGASA